MRDDVSSHVPSLGHDQNTRGKAHVYAAMTHRVTLLAGVVHKMKKNSAKLKPVSTSPLPILLAFWLSVGDRKVKRHGALIRLRCESLSEQEAAQEGSTIVIDSSGGLGKESSFVRTNWPTWR